MLKLQTEDFSTLAICAIRYCHGRMTYMPDLVRNIIRPHLRELSDKDLTVMIDDCDFQERMHLYGDERIDKPGWLKWKDELIAEKERRRKGEPMGDIMRCKSCVWYTKIDRNTGVCVWRLEPKTKNSCCPEWIPKGRRTDGTNDE